MKKKQRGLKSNQLSNIGSLSLSAADIGLAFNGYPGIKDLLTSIRALVEERKINFLDTLIFVMYSKGEINDDNIQSLKTKINDSEVILRYLERCQHAFNNSNGLLTRQILAIYSGRVINDTSLLNSYSSSVIIDVLSAINDFDLVYFELAYDKILENDQPSIDALKLFNLIKHYSILESTNPLDFVSSIKKLTSLMVFEESTGLAFDMDDEFIVYLNDYSNMLKELIVEHKALLGNNDQ